MMMPQTGRMAGKATGRTRPAYLRGNFEGTDGGRNAARIWAGVGEELSGEKWLVTLRHGRWLALSGLEADYADRHEAASVEEIVAGAHVLGHAQSAVKAGEVVKVALTDAGIEYLITRDSGHANVGALLVLGFLALPFMVAAFALFAVGYIAVGIYCLLTGTRFPRLPKDDVCH